MTGLSTTLFTAVIAYGTPLLGFCLLLGGLGVPLPTTLLVVAAGAFVRQGVLSPQVVGIGLVCVLIGDSLSFGLGRLGHSWLTRRFGQNTGWQQARQTFEQRGGVAIYLTRWLLTGIAIPTNLVAGGSGYGFRRFLLFDLTGEATWLAVFGGLGYWLGSQWEQAEALISTLSGPVFGLVAVGTLLYLGGRKVWGRMQLRSAPA